MDKFKVTIAVNDLKVGMICAQEVKAQKNVLIGKGVPITQLIINKLRDVYFYDELEVFCDEAPIPDYIPSTRIKTIQQIEKDFNDLAFDVQMIFENMEHLKSSTMEEVRKFAEKIQNELEYASYIIKDIVLYGSGSDTIYRHSVNVSALCAILGKWAGLSSKDINLLTYAAVLHDFGKTKIDKAILDKEGSLTKKEFAAIKKHPIIGYDYIKKVKFLDKSVSYGVLMHHEKSDGTGYPLGLKENEISKFAKIIAIADVFDAVNSDRIYKKSKSPFEALKLIHRESLMKLDYELSILFLNHLVNYYMGESVMLSDGSICKIIQINLNNIEKPLLLNGTSFIDLNHEKDLYIEKLIL